MIGKKDVNYSLQSVTVVVDTQRPRRHFLLNHNLIMSYSHYTSQQWVSHGSFLHLRFVALLKFEGSGGKKKKKEREEKTVTSCVSMHQQALIYTAVRKL